MTCCPICKITRNESIEENECGCPRFYADNEGEIMIVWRGYPFKLKEFMEIQRTANHTGWCRIKHGRGIK